MSTFFLPHMSAVLLTRKRPSKWYMSGHGDMDERKPCPNNRNDQGWALLEVLISPARRGGRPRTVKMREVPNTILYGVKTGYRHLVYS